MMEMDQPTIKWIYKTAHKELWRVVHYYQVDDLIQDGFMHYCRVATKYAHIKERPHLMGLFKVAFINHIHNLSKDRTRRAGINCQYDDAMRDLMHDQELATVHTIASQAPPHVRAALAIFASEEGCRQLREPTKVNNHHRETNNERLCRLTGHEGNILGDLKDYCSAV